MSHKRVPFTKKASKGKFGSKQLDSAPVAAPVAEAMLPYTEEARADGGAGAETPVSEKLALLERGVRGISKDNMGLARSQADTLAVLQQVLARFDDLDLVVKGVSQTVWRAVQEGQGQVASAEQHFAGALRDLETRITGEMEWQLHRAAILSLLPALDDMDHVLALHRRTLESAGQEDGFFEAMVLVRQRFVQALGRLGLEEIPIEAGQTRFDNMLHESAQPDFAPDLLDGQDAAPGTILWVRRAGFTFRGQLFRPAAVIIQS